jgi:hypothetical protein
MMPKLIVVGGLIECSHGGKARLKSGNAKLKINGAEVVTAGGEMGLSFLPSTAPPTPDNPAPCPHVGPGAPSPCAATLAAVAGVSTKTKVGGVGVLLDTATGPATNPNDPSAKWKISDAGQDLMKEA